MFYLICSIACSIGVSAVFKANEVRRGDRGTLLTVNYAVATACAWAVPTVDGASGMVSYGAGMIGLTVLTGTLFIVTYFVLALATRVAGMGLATGVMRVSVVLPVLASWWIWREVPTGGQGAALVVAAAAFFCISNRSEDAPEAPDTAPDRFRSGGSSSRATVESDGSSGTSGTPDTDDGEAGGSGYRPGLAFGVLLLLFVAGGAVDTCIKGFDELYAGRYSDTVFLTGVYAVATVMGGGVVAVRRARRGQWPATAVLGWGLLLGVLNYFATLFFLKAVRLLEGPFVFPANSVSIVVGAALVGVYFWDERLSRLNRIGLGLAVVALVLLRV